MVSEPIVFSGRIRVEQDTYLGGAEVQLIDEKTEQVITTDVSDEDGQYRLVPALNKHSEFLKRRPVATIRVIDKNATVLAESETIQWDIGDVHDHDLEVSGDLVEEFAPVGRLPSAMEGPIFNPGALETIDEAIQLFAPRGERTFRIYANAARCPNPDIFEHDNITDHAQGTLRGNERARRQLVGTLELHARRRPDNQPAVLEKMLFDAEDRPLEKGLREPETSFSQALSFEDSVGLTPKPPPHNEPSCFVPDDRFSLIASAAVFAAEDKAHATHLIRGLEHGLCGLNESNIILDAARGALKSGDPSHLRAVLDGFVQECGPDDGPVGGPDIEGPPQDCSPPFPKRPPVDRCPPTRVCLEDLAEALPFLMSKTRYTITDVSPDDACAGATITIKGRNFGSAPGRVCFSRESGSMSPGTCVAAQSWSNTQVTVTVPQNAEGGYVSLQIKERTVRICGNVIPVFRKGNSVRFDGAEPTLDLSVDGQTTDACLKPGENVAIRWDAMPLDASVDVEIEQGGTPVDNWSGQSHANGRQWAAPSVNSPTTYTVTATAQASCGTVTETVAVHVGREPNLTIDGVEVTQAIQYYDAGQHLTNANDQGPDNSVTLVADKAAWVRVYVRSGLPGSFNGGQLNGVTGTLKVERIRGGSVINSTTLTPVNPGGTVTAQSNPGYAAERSTLNASLNFVIPANLMRNLVRLRLELNTSDPCWPQSVTDTLDLQVGLRQQLQVAGIMVGYTGQNPNPPPQQLTLAAPNTANLRNTAALAYRMFPVAAPQPGNFRNVGTITLNQPLTDPPNCQGCCSTRWVQLNNQIAAQAAADGNRNGWLYYGLMANGIPMGPIVGCNSNGVSSGSNGAAVTMAHEIGHALGLQHAPCGNVGNSADNSYPAYEPYDPSNNAQGRIGEYGLDIGPGTIQGPNTRDVMGYCGTNWISLYHHSQLLNAGGLTTRNVPTASTALMDRNAITPRPSIVLIGTVEGGRELRVDHVLRVTTRPDPGDGQQTDMIAEVRDADGEVISSGVVYVFESQEQRDGRIDSPATERELRGIQAFLPEQENSGAKLTVRLGDEVLWEREAPDAEPQVEITGLEVGEETVQLAWKFETSSEYPTDIMIRWSTDGEDWTVLAGGLAGEEAKLDIRHLPSGGVQFQVLASDGFYTRTATSDPVEIPHRAPEVKIVSPNDAIPANAPVLYLSCLVQHGTDVNENCVWYLNGEEVGTGTEVWMSVPKVGDHDIRVEFQGDEGEDSTEQSLTVFDPSSENYHQEKI
jgi:hypothetical protein